MDTVVIKLDERGNISTATTNGEPVRVVIVEPDLIGKCDVVLDGEDHVAYEVDADNENVSLWNEVNSQLSNRSS